MHTNMSEFIPGLIIIEHETNLLLILKWVSNIRGNNELDQFEFMTRYIGIYPFENVYH